MSRPSRRSAFEIYRDALLVLALDSQPLKRTNFMYALQMSWSPFIKLLDDLVEKKLVEKIDPYEYRKSMAGHGGRYRRRTVDGRTKFLVSITMKGQYVLRWLDELLKYIVDDSDPNIRPPMWILQTLFRHRIEDLKVDSIDPFTVMERRLEVAVGGGLRLSLMPPMRAGVKSLPCSFKIVSRGSAMLPAKLVVRQERSKHMPKSGLDTGSMFCPECGTRCSNLHGLKIHVGRTHPDEKDEIMSQINRFRMVMI